MSKRIEFSCLALAGTGIAVALYAFGSGQRSRSQADAAARERARLAPLAQAKQEAEWTRRAVNYTSEGKR